MRARRPRLGVWDDSIVGMRRKAIVRRDGVEMVLYRIEPGSLFPAHTHPEAQFAYLLGGSGVQRVGGMVRHVRPGDAWYIPPSTPHEFETDPKGTVVMINILVAQPEGTSSQAAVAQRLLAEAAAESIAHTSYVGSGRIRRVRASASS